MQFPTKEDYPDDKEGFKDARREYMSARRKFQYSGTKAAKADKIKTIKEALARAEAEEAAEDE